MTPTPTHTGTDRASEITPEWVAVMGVLHAAYDLGMSGDPAETTDPEQIQRRLRLVSACGAASDRITALAAECERMRAAMEPLSAAAESVLMVAAPHPKEYGLAIVDCHSLMQLGMTRETAEQALAPAPPAATSEAGTSE